MNNLDVLKAAGVLDKQTRPLDMGDYSPQYAGQMLQVWVNPPGVFDDFVNDNDTPDMDRYRRIVNILFEFPVEIVNSMDDDLVTWLFSAGYRVYDEYHAALKKTSVTS